MADAINKDLLKSIILLHERMQNIEQKLVAFNIPGFGSKEPSKGEQAVEELKKNLEPRVASLETNLNYTMAILTQRGIWGAPSSQPPPTFPPPPSHANKYNQGYVHS